MSLALTFLITLLATLVVDQMSKAVVAHRRLPALRYNAWPGLVSISTPAAALLWSLSLTAALVLMAMAAPLPASGVVGLALALGGAAGNLCDRLLRGAVIDFIAIGRWPAFNLADSALVAGAALCIWAWL